MNLQEIKNILQAELKGEDKNFQTISIDSRSLEQKSLFFAIAGQNFDGHDYVAEAASKGAVAAVVERVVQTNIPLLLVKNTKKALAELAAYYRQQMNPCVIAMTGSCGKTTVRALVASIFGRYGATLSSEKSYNNEIGVPLTLLRLTREHQFAVCELGANHLGEIAKLTEIVKPDVAIITNAASAHLAGFGSVDGVAQEKGKIYEGLKATGVAVINNDDHYAEFWKKLAGDRKKITFGIKQQSDVMATNIQFNDKAQAQFQLILPNGKILVQMRLMGAHNVNNALAAAAAAYAKNIPIETIKEGLETCEAVNQRLVETKGYAGATIIDDSYNANPLSVTAAIDVLVRRNGEKILVLGDMGELGERSAQLHTEIGAEALKRGVDRLYGYGVHTQHTVQKFGKNGHYFADQKQLIDAVKKDLSSQVTVLVKGSLSMKMGLVAAALLER